MALLLADRKEKYLMVFADTGAEYPETLEYIEYFQEATGLPIDIVKANKVENLDCSRRGLLDYCYKRTLIPMRAFRWCTEKFKIGPLYNYQLRNNVHHQYIGFDADESRRVKNFNNLFITTSYPLIEAGINRQGCIDIIAAHGLKVPRKSGCWCCPFQALSGWKYLYLKHPLLWDKAVNMERAVIERRGGDMRATLWRSGKTLEDMAKRFGEDDAAATLKMHDTSEIPCGCYDG